MPDYGLIPAPAIYLSINNRRRGRLPFHARRLTLLMSVNRQKNKRHGRGYWDYYLAQDKMGGQRRCAHRHQTPIDHWAEDILFLKTRRKKLSYLSPVAIRGGMARHRYILPLLSKRKNHPPYPFQQWGMMAGLHPSPLGLLIHPRYGLWVSFRGAILERTPPKKRFKNFPHPCATCQTKPCITTCPAAAVTIDKDFNYQACHSYVVKNHHGDCCAIGCLSRRACPIAPHLAFTLEQNRKQWKSLLSHVGLDTGM